MWIGYRPNVPPDPASGLRPGKKRTLLSETPPPRRPVPARLARLRPQRRPAPPGPADLGAPALRRLRTAVLVGGVVLVVVGAFEALRFTWAFGLLAAGTGGFALRLGPSIGRTVTDARLPADDRGDPRVWWTVPVAALGALAWGLVRLSQLGG